MIPAIEFENVSFEYGTPARAAKKRGLFCSRRLAAKRVLSTADAAGDSVGGAGKGLTIRLPEGLGNTRERRQIPADT